MLHQCSSILLQKESIDRTETITGFSSLYTEKKFFRKCQPKNSKGNNLFCRSTNCIFQVVLPVDR